jgi:hypothetical protein
MKKITISINGKDYPCYMTMGAIVYFKRLSGKDISKLIEGDLEDNLMMIYCVLKAASKAEGVPFDTDFPTYEDFIVAITPDEMAGMRTLVEAQLTSQAADVDDSKKKRAKK